METITFFFIIIITAVTYLIAAFFWYFVKTREINNSKLSYNQKETHKTKLFQTFLQITTIILTSILTLSALSVSAGSLILQKNFADEQIKILKETASTNWPNVEIELKHPDLSNQFSTKELRSKDHLSINIIMINSGKTSTGDIRLESYRNNKYIYAFTEKEIEIKPQSGEKIEIQLNQMYCDRDETTQECIEETPLRGNYNFTMTFYCEFCKTRYINFTTPICIWEKNSRECDND